MSFVDREIVCLDCSQPFVFTAGEQEFYDRKGFKEEPKRCKPCREARKQRRSDTPVTGPGRAARGDDAGNGFARPPAGGFGFRGASDEGAGDDREESLGNRAFTASNDDDSIGNRAPGGFAAPARPRAAGPRGPARERGVRAGGGNGSAGNGSAGGDRRELHDATCAQCGAGARVPFKPVAGRPVYCRDCYASRAASAGGR